MEREYNMAIDMWALGTFFSFLIDFFIKNYNKIFIIILGCIFAEL